MSTSLNMRGGNVVKSGIFVTWNFRAYIHIHGQ